jgi:hypothetical protein
MNFNMASDGVATSTGPLIQQQYNSVTNLQIGGPSGVVTAAGAISAGSWKTTTPCAATAGTSPAACGAAPSGSFRVAASTTTFTVNTSIMTATTTCQFGYDTEGITAPTNTTALLLPIMTGRSVGTSFTLGFPTAPATNSITVTYRCEN